jgi:hypothetical protein
MDELVMHIEQRFSRIAAKRVFHFRADTGTIAINESSFVSIDRPMQEAHPSQMLYVDGGQGVIFETASMCVSRIRIVGVIFEGQKRTKTLSETFDLSCSIDASADHKTNIKINFNTFPQLPASFAGLWLGEAEAQVKQGGLSSSSVVLRAALESYYASLWAIKNRVACVVLDGPLAARKDMRYAFQKNLIEEGIAVVGVHKTSSLVCDDGTSVMSVVRLLSKKQAYLRLYAPKESAWPRYVALLHEHARSGFMIDIAHRLDLDKQNVAPGKDGKQAISALMGALVQVSCDCSWLGYPYPLIFADQLARVSLEEMRNARMRLIVSLPHQGLIESELMSSESHDVLDTLQYSAR